MYDIIYQSIRQNKSEQIINSKNDKSEYVILGALGLSPD